MAINGADILIKNKRFDLKTVLAVLNNLLTYYAATGGGLSRLIIVRQRWLVLSNGYAVYYGIFKFSL
ncbi:MAG: hypothetical protein ACJASB_003486 [Shewanella psychromarinicola]